MDTPLQPSIHIDLGELSLTASLRVASIIGREEISKLYRFDVQILAAKEIDQFETAVLSKPATIALTVGNTSRLIHGIVAQVEAQGSLGHGWRGYRLRVVPRLWLAKRRKNNRVFQDRNVLEIVTLLLKEHDVAFHLHATAQYPTRTYCVQYQETDYAFLSRLLAKEGLFFYFDHPSQSRDESETLMGPSEVVVISDSPDHYLSIGQRGDLHAGHDAGSGMAARDDQVFAFRSTRRVKSRGVVVRGYDFHRPAFDIPETRTAQEPFARTDAKGDARERQPGGLYGPLTSNGANQTQTIYEHEGSYENAPAEPTPALIPFERERARVETAEGVSYCRWLMSGQTFSLHGHSAGALNQDYVVTSVTHEAYTAESIPKGKELYQNRFRCMPATVRFRVPARRKPVDQITETATVVGPLGEEIYTDKFGRIKVQFHWDREGKRDANSSCWIRVAQPWAGQGWGFQFIPRIGTEVLVTFLGGDASRPVVTHCLYNATSPAPFPPTMEKTRSGIRTASTPGGRGHNELSFEDMAGAEEVYLAATANFRESVGEDHHVKVARDEMIQIGGQQTTSVAGAVASNIGGSSSSNIAGSVSENIAKNKSMTIKGAIEQSVGDKATFGFDDTLTLRVAGHFNTTVGGKEGTATSGFYAKDAYSVGTDGKLTLRARQGILLECGESRIEIDPDKVVIHAKEIVLAGSKSASIMGQGPALHLTEEAEIVSKKIRIFSAKASLELDDDASLRGQLVKLNCDDGESSEGGAQTDPEETKPLKLKLMNDKLEPYAGKKYRLVVNGKVTEGETGGDGSLEQSIPKAAKTAELELWIENYPTGKRRYWALELPDELPLPSTVRGAQMRLTNAGYFKGAIGDEIDDDTKNAIRRFQKDRGILATGELDVATVAALHDLQGH